MSWCSSRQAVHAAFEILRTSTHLFVDCEGDELGCEGGQLSVVSIGTALARHVFLFDVLALSNEDLQPIIHLLSNEWTLKIVWDGRMDSVEFQRAFGIRLGRVVDLQIADVLSRRQSAEQRMLRPWDPLHGVRHLDTAGVHGLTGLKYALKEHGMDGGARGSRGLDHQWWLMRPLPSHYLSYAAEDIHLLSQVHAVFHLLSHVGTTARSMSQLEIQSARYVNMHNGVPPRIGDRYRSSNLLPMEILAVADAGPIFRCDGCTRLLSQSSFSYGEASGGPRTLHSCCKVCFLITQRAISKQTTKDLGSGRRATSSTSRYAGTFDGLTPVQTQPQRIL